MRLIQGKQNAVGRGDEIGFLTDAPFLKKTSGRAGTQKFLLN